MAPLNDPIRLQCYKNALQNWRYNGYVVFRDRAEKWIRAQLPGYSLKALAEMLFQHVEAGGKVDEQPEKRPEWSDRYEFHHDIRITISGRLIYFETVLLAGKSDDLDGSTIFVVNVHDA